MYLKAEGTMDTDSGEGESADGEGADGAESDDAGEYSDDEDVSWKVRRAAARTLEALISAVAARPEPAGALSALGTLAKSLGPPLIGRFKEREENVRVDILQVYIALLRALRLAFVQTQLSQTSATGLPACGPAEHSLFR